MATSEALNVRVHRGKGDVTVIEAVGHGTVVLDGAGLAFCDSAGLRALAEARQCARAAGAVRRIAAPSPALIRVLEVAGALAVFEVYPDVETALKD